MTDSSKNDLNHPPRTWLVLGDKLGDNAQVERVAKDLGWATGVRRLTFLEEYRFGKPKFRPSLYHVDLDESDDLLGPWPDLILTVGRRPAMVALWIKKQSGGRTKVVLFGRPTSSIRDFSLIVSPSQYSLPARANVLPIKFPLMRIDPQRLSDARLAWADHFASMEKPLTAVLVGGPTQPFVFSENAARDMAEKIIRLKNQSGGSVYVTTSRRTPKKVSEVLACELAAHNELHLFGDSNKENPYLGLLAWADRFVVTGDSISMMIEVAGAGKPLAIHELPVARGWKALSRQMSMRLFYQKKAPLALVAAAMRRLGWERYPRDLGAIHRELYDCGAARPLSRGFSDTVAMIDNEVPKVIDKIRELMASNGEMTAG